MKLEEFIELLREYGVKPVQMDVRIVCINPEDADKENPPTWAEEIELDENTDTGEFEVVVYMGERDSDSPCNDNADLSGTKVKNAPLFLEGRILFKMMRVWREQIKSKRKIGEEYEK